MTHMLRTIDDAAFGLLTQELYDLRRAPSGMFVVVTRVTHVLEKKSVASGGAQHRVGTPMSMGTKEFTRISQVPTPPSKTCLARMCVASPHV